MDKDSAMKTAKAIRGRQDEFLPSYYHETIAAALIAAGGKSD